LEGRDAAGRIFSSLGMAGPGWTVLGRSGFANDLAANSSQKQSATDPASK